MNKPILIMGGVILAGLIGCNVAVWATVNNTPPTIPAASAAEANLVCTSFSGLSSFTVAALPPLPASAADGPLQRYRVTATCKSSHVVTGTIELKTEGS